MQFELTRYLSDNWVPVIEKDVDGPNSLPLRIDGEVPNLGKFAACRRVARTIYLGSAPTTQAAHRGIEDRRVKLGCVMPGESPAVFGDALRRLAGAATYLYQDGAALLVLDAADGHQAGRGPGGAAQARPRQGGAGDRAAAAQGPASRRATSAGFTRCRSPGRTCRTTWTRGWSCWASTLPTAKKSGTRREVAAQAILETRGNTPRLYRNTLVFLAVDKTRLQDLDEAVRRYLAWESILAEKEALEPRSAPGQAGRDAEDVRRQRGDRAAARDLPVAAGARAGDAAGAVAWQAIRLTGTDALAVRASKKLKNDDLLATTLAGTMLRMWMDKVPLWRGDHVPVRQLAEDFARYCYLPRLRDAGVLAEAVRSGLALLTWEQDTFAWADSWDEAAGRYRGLRGGQHVTLDATSTGLLVKPGVACAQLEAERRAAEAAPRRPAKMATREALSVARRRRLVRAAAPQRQLCPQGDSNPYTPAQNAIMGR